MTFSFKMTGDVQRFRRFFNMQNWTGNLDKNLRRATLRNALFLQKKVKKLIREEEYKANSELTLSLKGSNKPLIDQRNLWNAIDTVLYDSFSGEVGILRNAGSTGSKFGLAKSQINIKHLVEMMESGYVIKVTDKMRQAIAMTLQNDKTSKGKLRARSRKALERIAGARGKGKNTFVVTARPLLSKVFNDPATKRVLIHNWRVGLEGAFLAGGLKDGEHKDK